MAMVQPFWQRQSTSGLSSLLEFRLFGLSRIFREQTRNRRRLIGIAAVVLSSVALARNQNRQKSTDPF